MSDRARANEPTHGHPIHPPARPRPLIFLGLAAWFTILAVLRLTVPPVRTVVWALVAASSVVAMVVGIIHNRPRRPGPWLLFTAAVACFGVGDVTGEVLDNAGITWFPSIVDVLYLIVYLLIAAGIVWLYRLGVVQRDAAGILDAPAITTGIGLLAWVFLIAPYTKNPDLSVLEKIIVAAYPLEDLLLIAAGGAVIVSMRPTVALRLLALGVAGLLASDIAYSLIELYGGAFRHGTPVDLGWVLFYLCWGLAALHPSMRELTEPKLLRERHEGVRASRWVLLGVASLIAPVVLVVEVLVSGVEDGIAIAILSALLSILILIRLSRSVASQGRSAQRARALRAAGAEMLSTTDASDLSAVVTRAVAQLLPPGRPHQVVFDLADPGSRTEAGQPDGAPPPGPVEGDRGPDLVRAADLPTRVAPRLDGFDVTLRRDVPGLRGQPAGTLYVAAEEALLSTLQESTQILAGQAGLTLQRIELSVEVQRNLAYRASHDPLTGLLTADALSTETRARQTDEDRRSAEAPWRSALYIDLDKFKNVNDEFGHQIGDKLLVEVADRIRARLRHGDVAARLGGDEFAVVLRDLTSAETARAIAQRLTDALAGPVRIDDIEIDTRASIGLAYAGRGEEIGTLLRDADAALYDAKAHGKGQWREFRPGMQTPALAQLADRRRVQDAIDGQRLVLHYQPIVALQTGRPVGFEALLRFPGAEPPMLANEVITTTEEASLIATLGDWILHQAITDLAKLNPPGSPTRRYVSVNISPRQPQQTNFADRIRAHLAAAGADPALLVLEVTERLSADDGRGWQVLADLRGDGVRVAIDDYGSGCASLSYLRQSAIDLVKIDQSFLSEDDHHRNRPLLTAVINLCRQLGIETIAEGIGGRDAEQFLLASDCHYGQGFYYAHAMPIDDAARWNGRT